MNQDQQEILSRLEQTVETGLETFTAGLAAVKEKLLRELENLLGSLRKRRNGVVYGNSYNYRLINQFSKDFNKLLEQSGYKSLVREFVGQYSTVATVAEEYFKTLVPSFSIKALYAEIKKANIATTVDLLLGAGIDANFKQPIIKVLRQNLAGNTEINALAKLMRTEIMGDAERLGRLERYAGKVTVDSVNQYTRGYIEAISTDLGLKYGLYGGTTIRDSREFCRRRAGRYFSLEELQSFASQDWSGKVAGTNATNIRTFLGGHQCRHFWYPVTKELYEREKARGRAGLV